MDSTARLSSFRADCTTFISAELALEQGGLGQQCEVDLSENFIERK